MASNASLRVVEDPAAADRARAVRAVQLITVAWMFVEVLVSLVAAARAHSVALFAFGGDSVIELASALVVLSRFTSRGLSERTAARTAAVLLFMLAVFIIATSGLSLLGIGLQPTPSYLGIGLLMAAAVVMPWLANQKKRLARETGSSALAADAVQSSLCAYLSWIALLGLLLNSMFGISWADPAAALALTPLVIKEGWDAWHMKGCHCC
jgi:divalent metal cation (Fe/Co/Zn/Cd) transporter